MNQFSIVVPTMWKYKPFIDFVVDLVDFPMVGEIIIINNAIQDTPDHPILHDPKIKLYNFPKNIYVNPAFNLGVAASRFDNICLLNDDMVFDFKIFQKVSKVISPTVGVIGISPGLEQFKQDQFKTGNIKIIPWTGQHTFGFGCLMFIHKLAYEPIPDSFVLYYGDNWIFDTALARGFTNYVITDAWSYTPYAQTCKDMAEKDQMLESETSAFRQAMTEYRHNKLK